MIRRGLLSPNWSKHNLLGLDPDALAWQAAVVSAGGTVSSARLLSNSNYIKLLKSSTPNLWALYDRFWIWSAENTQSSLIDWKFRQTATPVNSPTFTVDKGWTTASPNVYIDTNYVPSTSLVNMSLNSAHLSYYCNSLDPTNHNAFVGVLNNGITMFGLDSPYLDGNMYARINHDPSGGGFAMGATTGLGIGDRPNSTSVVSCFAGTDLGTETHNSVGLPTNSVWVGVLDLDGVPNAATGAQYAMTSMGASLGSPGRANHTILTTNYLTSIGAN